MKDYYNQHWVYDHCLKLEQLGNKAELKSLQRNYWKKIVNYKDLLHCIVRLGTLLVNKSDQQMISFINYTANHYYYYYYYYFQG